LDKCRKKRGEQAALFSVDEASDILEMKDVLNLSCRELAKIVGCSKATIQRLANGTQQHFRVV
jgi:transposase